MNKEQKPEHKVKTYMREGVELCDFCGCHILTRAGGGHHSAECVDRRAKPEPAGELVERLLTEPYDPHWKHTVIIRTEDRDELCRRITQLEKDKAEQAEENKRLRDALEEASHMIYGELYFDHPTVIKVKNALKEK